MRDTWVAGNGIYQFMAPTKIIYGFESLKQLGNELLNLGRKKYLIVADPHCIESGLIKNVGESLRSLNIQYAQFDGILHEPDAEQINECLKVYQAEKCEGIVCIGGGSTIDTGKGAGVLAMNKGSIEDYAGFMKVKNPLPPLVCVPTTYGSGSEVGPACVVKDKKRKFKYPVGSPFIIPKVAILDPTLVNKLPPRIAASSGIDALTHAVEGLCSPAMHPYAEARSLTAIELIGKNIRKASITEEIQPSMMMQIAGSMALQASSHTKLGPIHAMGHALGAVADVPHGIACGVFMTHVLEFNLIGCPDKFRAIARALNVDSVELTDIQAGKRAIQEISQIMADLDLPTSLRDVGCSEEIIPSLIEGTMMLKLFLENNHRVVGEKEIVGLLKKTY